MWPAGFRLENETVLDAKGEAVAVVGKPVRLGGGEYHESQYGFLRSLMNGDVAAACRGGEASELLSSCVETPFRLYVIRPLAPPLVVAA